MTYPQNFRQALMLHLLRTAWLSSQLQPVQSLYTESLTVSLCPRKHFLVRSPRLLSKRKLYIAKLNITEGPAVKKKQNRHTGTNTQAIIKRNLRAIIVALIRFRFSLVHVFIATPSLFTTSPVFPAILHFSIITPTLSGLEQEDGHQRQTGHGAKYTVGHFFRRNGKNVEVNIFRDIITLEM